MSIITDIGRMNCQNGEFISGYQQFLKAIDLTVDISHTKRQRCKNIIYKISLPNSA